VEFNCSGHGDYYINLNSVRLFLRIKLVENDGSDLTSAEPNTVGFVYNLLHSIFSSLSVSLNGKSLLFTDKTILQYLPLRASKLRF